MTFKLQVYVRSSSSFLLWEQISSSGYISSATSLQDRLGCSAIPGSNPLPTRATVRLTVHYGDAGFELQTAGAPPMSHHTPLLRCKSKTLKCSLKVIIRPNLIRSSLSWAYYGIDSFQLVFGEISQGSKFI
jgi:hypothetical protein